MRGDGLRAVNRVTRKGRKSEPHAWPMDATKLQPGEADRFFTNSTDRSMISPGGCWARNFLACGHDDPTAPTGGEKNSRDRGGSPRNHHSLRWGCSLCGAWFHAQPYRADPETQKIRSQFNLKRPEILVFGPQAPSAATIHARSRSRKSPSGLPRRSSALARHVPERA